MADVALTTFLKEREALISVALRIVQTRAVAEELVQDSWLRWDNKNYPSDKALPIFNRIVSNLARDWWQSRQTEEQILTDLMLLEDSDFDSERILIARQELRRVVEALEKMPQNTIYAFQMRFVDGLTFREIAKQLGLSRSRAHAILDEALITITCMLKQ
ncbi:MAG: sigma-70 family RNA polymerase sigma factor [Pseudomonadota bacterium]